MCTQQHKEINGNLLYTILWNETLDAQRMYTYNKAIKTLCCLHTNFNYKLNGQFRSYGFADVFMYVQNEEVINGWW